MAIYHLSVQIIGRSNGGSAVASSAYRATEKLHDETTGETFDYRRKEKAIASGIIAPKDSPEWANDRAKLWNEVEKKENRKNSAFCREMNIAIPAELKNEAEEIIKNYIKENFTSCGLVADYAIHKPNKKGDERNIHAHIMITKRAVNQNGWGEMYRVADDYKTKRLILNSWRESWEEICNKELERIGSKERISCETLANQGIEREAQQHMGKTATAMKRKGKETRRKKYRSEELPPLDEIKITENELSAELLKDPEYKNLLTLLHEAEKENDLQRFEKIIKNMNPQEWQNFRDEKYPKFIEQEKRHSIIEAVRPILPELEKLEKDNFTKKKKILDDHKRQKPTIAEKPKLSIFYSFKSDNGRTYNNYDEYKNAQREEISTWQFDHDRILSNAEQAQKLYKDVLTAQKTNEPQDLWTVARNVEKYRPQLFEKIKNKAHEIFETSPIFKPIRAMRDAYENHKMKKNQELLSWANQQNKNRPKTRERNDGRRSR